MAFLRVHAQSLLCHGDLQFTNIFLSQSDKRSFEELENTPMPALFLCSPALKKPKGVNTIWNLRGQNGNLGFHVYSQKQYGQNAFRPMPLLIWTAHTPSLNLFLQVRCVHFCEKKKTSLHISKSFRISTNSGVIKRSLN